MQKLTGYTAFVFYKIYAPVRGGPQGTIFSLLTPSNN